ncbi:MAG TPA: hypothetical protein VFZ34_30320 [Blastocatellia bacterium]|nr:hypothetical protein [Blastocatellia bacterium]
MKTLKFFVALFALTFVALTAVSAQTSRAAAWKQRVADQAAANAQALPASSQAERVADTTETPEIKQPESKQKDDAQAELLSSRLGDARSQIKNALAGTWDLTLTFSDGSQVKSTLNVALGRRDGEGSVIHAAEASLLLPNPTTPEQGAWEHVGGLRFVASYKGFAVDEKFEKPAGKIGFRHSIRLHPDQESFTGHAVFEVLDLEGHVVFSDHIKTEGKRQHAEAP